MRYDVRVEYDDDNGKHHSEDYVADIPLLVGLSYVNLKWIHEAAESLDKIATT